MSEASMMPPRVDLGRHYSSTMAQCMGQYRQWRGGKIDLAARRVIMGFALPSWQRGLVWSRGRHRFAGCRRRIECYDAALKFPLAR